MTYEAYLSKEIKVALKNDPPGEWLPNIPDDCILLSAGYPAPDLVPFSELKNAVARLLDEEHDLPLQYIGSPRIPQLKEQIKERLVERGIAVADNELLVTSGACQAIDLIARILVDDETVIALEAPTYMEALEIFRNYTDHIISIPVDEHGLQTDRLADILAERMRQGLPLPRLLYTIPTFQNPTGTTMTQERRQHVLALAATYDFLIIEDDAYGELAFNNRPSPLKTFDKDARVLHVGSLSKTVAPGMRMGWVTGASDLITALAWFKKDLDHPFAQATMATFLEHTDFEERLDTLTNIYKPKCATLITALEQYLPDSVSWYIPEGGYFVWIQLPGVDTSHLLTRALAEGVSYIPGKYFFLNREDGIEYLRLSFSYATEKDIIDGIKKLAKVIREGSQWN